jgi:hypothetical protein
VVVIGESVQFLTRAQQQLTHGLDLEPYGLQYPPVEGLPGEQLRQLVVPSPNLFDVVL